MFIVRERQRTLDLSKVFFWFIIYSIIGWAYETAYCSITTQKIADRGVLYGPVCPIYGVCIVLMIIIFEKKRSTITLFLQCALLATIVEYTVSYSMESVFHRRWWNYSNMLLNIDGRICIFASILFGVSGVLIVKFIHPTLVQYFNQNISDKALKNMNRVFIILYIYDNFITFRPLIF